MANIVAFKGLRYNPEKIANLSSVVTPPYDIIDETAQTKYYAEHPANIIRLELGLTFPQDTPSNNRYTRAKNYIEKWLEEEILLPEQLPSLYLYEQEFLIQGMRTVRTGFVCGLKVEPYEQGTVLPHEETLSKPKADRLQLMRATKSNFSSIFGLYSDEKRTVELILKESIKGKLPDIDIVDEANETHRIWVINNPEVIQAVLSFMADKQIFIADGHHRYETALEYASEMREHGLPDYDYVLTTLVNLFDEGLLVLPTHRVVGNIKSFSSAKLLKELNKLFDIDTYPDKNHLDEFINELKLRGTKQPVFGMYVDENLYLLQLKDPQTLEQYLPRERSDAWKNLDVAILDHMILDNIMGIGAQERKNQDNLAYSRSEQWVIEQIDNKQYQVGFLINATGVDEIVAVAQAGDKMPQKSTYFYPKLITGLIINNLDIR
ncbi:MAG: DUF1015 domain-containing protein [Syntrophomonadaceae bacterium]|jgi:uncharacterized protein (DUF1015 family)